MASEIGVDPDSKNPRYRRKDKALGLLCSNFLDLYNRDDVQSVGVDHAASQLGVERRRIYDIVNILESIGVITKKAKNQYTWKGLSMIPHALDVLKEEGLSDKLNAATWHNFANVQVLSRGSDENKQTTTPNSKPYMEEKAENRRAKLLGVLTQNFVKLFLCTDMDLISFESASSALLQDTHDPASMRTKVRRLYDIANVFVSINLIEKTRDSQNGKLAFRWIGTKGNSRKRSFTNSSIDDSERRTFGTDITNKVSNKYNADFSSHANLNKRQNIPMNHEQKESTAHEKHLMNAPKSFVFGPFAPAIWPSVGVSENSRLHQNPDWENLASIYRPQYCNRALGDVLAHYVEAWQMWNVEAIEEKHAKPVS